MAMIKQGIQKSTKQKKVVSSYGKKRDLVRLTMALPAMIKIFVFSYLPIFGIVLAFKNLNYKQGILGSPWCGLKNFEFFFKSDVAWRVTYNTLFMNALFIVTGLICSVFLSIMLYRVSKSNTMVKLYRSTMFFPYFLSWVLVAFLLNGLIGGNGAFTHLLEGLGFGKIQFYMEAKYWPAILTVVYIWKGVGYNCIIYYAVLLGIDESLYEAAEIDGASKRLIALKIQLPCMMPMIIMNLLLAIGSIFRADFGMFYFLPGSTNTLTLATTDVIDTYTFRALRDLGNISMSAAVGLYQSLVGFILITIANGIVKRYDAQLSLF